MHDDVERYIQRQVQDLLLRRNKAIVEANRLTLEIAALLESRRLQDVEAEACKRMADLIADGSEVKP